MTSTPPDTPPADPSAAEPTARERASWLAHNSRILVIALVVIVVAVVVATFSYSLFTSSSANPGNTVASGIMEQANDKEGQAILLAERLVPGDSADGVVSISNVGDAEGVFTLSATGLTDTPADPALSAVLTLTITQDGSEIYDGPLSEFDRVDLGTWDGGAQHDFTFTVTFDQSAGNEFQDASTELTFEWDATQSSS